MGKLHLGVAAVAGMVLPLAILLAWSPPSRIELDGWDNYYLSTYPATFSSQPKHLIIGTACWTWTAEAYMPIGSDKAEETQRATLHSALNTMMEGNGPERFYAFGTPEVDFERHLMSIRLAVRQGDVRSIIYINNPGSLQAFTKPENTVRVLPVLADIEREYPELAGDVETYRRILLASEGYQQGVEKVESASSPWGPSLLGPSWTGERWSRWLLGLSWRWRGAVDNLAFTPFVKRRTAEGVNDLFQEVKANYNNPVACSAPERGLLPTRLYWAGSGGETAWNAWMRLAVGMAARHGVKFIYYVPPHLNTPRDRYAAEFRPAFVDKVRTALAPFPNATVIDHAIGHGLSACDQVYDAELHFSAGYLFNFGGKLKQARLFLGALAEHGLLSAPPERFRSPSRWELELPQVRAEPKILSEEETEKVREELFSNEDWKLSLPAEDEANASNGEGRQ